jgi:hypothetical protein
VLGVELALASLAAIAIHVISDGRENASERDPILETASLEWVAGFAGTVRHATLKVLPCAMVGTLGVLAAAAWGLSRLGVWGQSNPFFVGGPREALTALRPANPAVWAPLALAATTAAAILWWLARPARRGAGLVVLLLADLFLLTRFVDVPPRVTRPDLSTPPAAAWLQQQAAKSGPSRGGRVWGLSSAYFHRQRELLLPKTCCLYGLATIAGYGPFQSPAHAHLLGFNIAGYDRDWADLLRRNRLLSLCNVRYILAEEGSEFERVLESVRVEASPPREEGPDLLGGRWTHNRTGEGGEGLWLRTPFLWSPSEARTTVALEPNALYRISLEARGPDGGAANFLRADVFRKGADYSWYQPEDWGLTVPGEQIVTDWRLFRWTFQTDGNVPSPLGFRLYSMSERTIEVRHLGVRKVSGWDCPEDANGLPAGAGVYRKVAQVPAVSLAEPPAESPSASLRAGLAEPPVVIYETLLARAAVPTAGEGLDWTEDRVEAVKWNRTAPSDPWAGFAPDVGLHSGRVRWMSLALATTLPAAAVYAAAAVLARRKRGKGP